MVWAGIFCTEAQIQSKEGAKVSASVTEAMHNQWVAEAESYINNLTRINFSDSFAGSLNVDVKATLTAAASSYAAMLGIAYDMSGYTSRTEAEMMINLNKTIWDECLAILLDQATITFINGA